MLGEILNDRKAKNIVTQLNTLRVWPSGLKGFFLRCKALLKKLVVSAFFDNFMTISVVINTVALALDRYQIPPSEKKILDTMNTVFTIIFLVEMVFKIAALGIKKYLSDGMNYMDGTIVILSVIELGMTSASGKTGGSSPLKTVKIFRIFRVLRVVRLLRSMKSM